MTPDDWERAVARLSWATNVTVFTGAGISAESGIATFRDDGGFWTRFPPEEFANWKGLLHLAVLDPARLAEFLIEVLGPIATASPNPGHAAIAKLEGRRPTTVITQNIDGLHQSAGSRHVLEVHGSLLEIVTWLGKEPLRTLTREDLQEIVRRIQDKCRSGWSGFQLLKAVEPLFGLSSRGFHRPNLVLFGDAMAEPAWSQAISAARSCELFISVGTSQSVYPAAMLIEEARDHGAETIVIDPQIGGGDIWLRGTAGDILPRLVQEADGE